ncbi:HNH endonuclease [Megamonas hypermegale]|uniref:HNH endonuclease n=1 Tax=Megamonas hypermegale TaxID=158847 RepID=UPI00195D9A14|nr:HNH endonuclease [Megamonas hypermegale]MBM6833947.1 HNH endonuclease [Megamonas hypermegale]
MKICDDYRNTKRSKILKYIVQKKENLECEVRDKHPRSSIYKNISNKKDIYFKKFAEIYNYKCAYCGISSEIKELILFEVDHFKCKASFSDEEGGVKEAGKLSNLVLACQPCNRKKREIVIDGMYKELLNTDNNEIKNIFYRDENYYIRISKEYVNDKFINSFYKKICFDADFRRLDYLLLEMNELIEYLNERKDINNKISSELKNCFIKLIKKRNNFLD